MKFSSWLLIAILIFVSLGFTDSILGDTAPPQMQLKTYPLHNKPHSADISPDEQLVVTASTSQTETAGSGVKQFAEVVQVWNFKEDKLVAEFRVHQADLKPTAIGRFLNPFGGAGIVRFSPDGSVVVAVIGKTIHVLRTRDLGEARSFPLAASCDKTQTIQGTETGDKPEVHAAEISPNGHVVAVLCVTGSHDGTIDLYDLSSGSSVQSWDTPRGWINYTEDLAWGPDGKLLLVAIPNVTACSSPNSRPDVFAFDTDSGTIKRKFTTGLLTGSIAVTSDNRVLAVDSNCLGVFKNHDPKLGVFDISTGKRVRAVPGRGAGVRYIVSASANGSRFLAFTGKIKTRFDWLDMALWDRVVDETFSVWNLKNYEGIVTSQNIPGLRYSSLRISPKGTYAVSCGLASFVYVLP